jgi:hypothetical protein
MRDLLNLKREIGADGLEVCADNHTVRVTAIAYRGGCMMTQTVEFDVVSLIEGIEPLEIVRKGLRQFAAATKVP